MYTPRPELKIWSHTQFVTLNIVFNGYAKHLYNSG